MKKDIRMIKISDIDKGPIRHPVLPESFIKRVKAYWQVLTEVEPSILQDAIHDFKYDLNPEKELIIWERIASTYQSYLSHNPTTDLATKKDVFAVLLGASMGTEEWDNIKHLTEDQINHLVLNYKGL